METGKGKNIKKQRQKYNKQLNNILENTFEKSGKKERNIEIVRHFYGMRNMEKLSISQCIKKYGISNPRVVGIIRKFKDAVKDKGLELPETRKKKTKSTS